MTDAVAIDVVDIVHEQLRILGMPGLSADEIRSDSLIVEDLGLDSMKFVELTLALENALGLSEFPMQEWVDERIRYSQPLTVGALIAACMKELGPSEVKR